MKNAQLYYRDSAALLARAKRTGSHVLSLAPTWNPIFLKNLQAARRIAVEGTHRSRLQSLPFLASSYVSDVLRVEIRSTALFQLVQVAERDIPNRSAFEELQALLASQAPALLEKINSLVSEIVFQRLEHRSECDVVAPPVQTRFPTNASAETVTVQPTKRGGSNSLDRRLGMATLRTTAAKIMLLEEIGPTVPLRKSELTESARQFVNRILTPILTCYREHFCSDLAAFIGTWGACFSHSKFKENCSVKNPCNK
uniref:Uncharacterized protein n=1 Tax=Spongospora subterranea TaxID=70186 RepID=A0A0H5QXY2_9EUKA|eukprot:CRZ06833.1 hypothetical protein [Spongospora subterranea]